MAIVGGGGKTGTATQLDTAVGGGYAVDTTAITSGTKVHAFGYPAAGKYKGKDLTYCAGPTFQDAEQRERDLGHRLQHDRRLVRRSVVQGLRRRPARAAASRR